MKQIIAVIRDERTAETEAALVHLGITAFILLPVMGRGMQKGMIGVPGQEGMLGRNAGLHLRRPVVSTVWPAYKPPAKKKAGLGFLPKHLLMILAPDEDVPSVVQILIAVNQSGRHGDGKIFVCPIGRTLGIDADGPKAP